MCYSSDMWNDKWLFCNWWKTAGSPHVGLGSPLCAPVPDRRLSHLKCIVVQNDSTLSFRLFFWLIPAPIISQKDGSLNFVVHTEFASVYEVVFCG